MSWGADKERADSGERAALEQLPGVRLLPAPERIKFSFQLTPEER